MKPRHYGYLYLPSRRVLPLPLALGRYLFPVPPRVRAGGWVRLIHTVTWKKTSRLIFGHNFSKCTPIFKILQLSDSQIKVYTCSHKNFLLTLSACNFKRNKKTVPDFNGIFHEISSFYLGRCVAHKIWQQCSSDQNKIRMSANWSCGWLKCGCGMDCSRLLSMNDGNICRLACVPGRTTWAQGETFGLCCSLWPPCATHADIILLPCGFFFFFFFLSLDKWHCLSSNRILTLLLDYLHSVLHISYKNVIILVIFVCHMASLCCPTFSSFMLFGSS